MSTFFTLSDLGLQVNTNTLLSQWLGYMQSVYPGYTPSSTNLEYVMAMIFATWAADLSAQASQGADDLFQAYGTKLINLPVNNGTSAIATAVIQAVDSQGYTLPAGSQFVVDGSTGFQNTLPVVIPAGSTNATFTISALTTGSDVNGAGATSIALNQQLNWVSSVAIATTASGGEDAETQESYLQRLTNTLQLLAPRPITASDFATFALNFVPTAGTDQEEVGRATAIDGYNPTTNTYNNERTITVCVADDTGSPLGVDTQVALQAYLQNAREVNFVVNVISPTYFPVYTSAQVHPTQGYASADVVSNISSTLQNLLSPSSWGTLPDSGGSGSWTNTTTVYRSVVEAAIQGTAGVDHVVNGSVGLGFSSASLAAGDLVLAGACPLPVTSLPNGTVTVPPSAFQVV